MRVAAFRALLGSYFVNEVGDSVGIVALALLVYDRADSALAPAALFVCARFIPAFLAPLLTARVDQHGLRRILPSLYLAETGAFALLAYLSNHYALAPVLAVGFIDGVLALTGRSLTRGAVATVLEPLGLLRAGNGHMNVAFSVAAVGGAALAGWLCQSIGIDWALLVDAGSFLIIAAVIGATAGLPDAKTVRQPVLQRFRDGLAHVRAVPTVRVLVLGEALALVMFTLVVPIEVVYARETLHASSAGYGVLLASWGVGLVLGSLVYLRVKDRSSLALIGASTLAIALAYLGMGATTELWVACAVSVVGGTGNGIQWVAVMTTVQEATPADLYARVSGLLESLGAAVPGAGFVIGGALVALADPPTAFFFAGGGLLVLLVGLAAFRSRVASAVRSEPTA